MTTIVWFRQDLRLADNPALSQAAEAGTIIPVFIRENGSLRERGGASKWWLHHSLEKLRESLGGLVLLTGSPEQVLKELAEKAGAGAVCWNRRYEPDAIETDKAVKAELEQSGLEVKTFNGRLLHEPWEIKTGDGGPYKVYSPFWRACLKKDVDPPLPKPDFKLAELPDCEKIEDWDLLPRNPNWAEGWDELWQPGEAGAIKRLDEFLDDGLEGYSDGRNFPARNNVSKLSPHLHFGEVSPRQIWAKTNFHSDENDSVAKDASKFLSEVGWREFSYHLLYHFPTLPTENWKPEFDDYPWRDSTDDMKAWQKGQTGYPMVDAGMRQLWHTGYMHNRVRMVVASFLVKHLRIHWREGETWFWDTLLDADCANNSASWQWVTGSGADAAPYFRIFNPTSQAKKFDPDGDYIRKWCPEIAELKGDALFAPFDASDKELGDAGVTLGKDYPKPIVDHAEARKAALGGYERIKK